MVQVAAPDGTAYCIDRTEVTQGEYQAFLASTVAEPGSEHESCAYNFSYEPEQYPSSIEWKPYCKSYTWTPDTSPRRPVDCVDWCDAVAFCKWAGKRLCGKVGGGQLQISGDPADYFSNPAFDPKSSQWYSACSQGGKTLYPYGDVYDPLACEGEDASLTADGGLAPKKDVVAHAGCHGSSEPYASIHDLSGSVAEWTDECFWSPSHSAPLCALRGGGRDHANGITCKWFETSFSAGRDEVGFRCCEDLP